VDNTLQRASLAEHPSPQVRMLISQGFGQQLDVRPAPEQDVLGVIEIKKAC
jgi:hypothetical protein